MITSSSRKILVANPPVDPSMYKILQPGRLSHIYLYEEEEDVDANIATPTTTDTDKSSPRYHLRIVDRNDLPNNFQTKKIQDKNKDKNKMIQYPCAVFLIPAGREIDYTFNKYPGLLHVAQSANCARLIAVALHRNHTYENQQIVQKELEYIIQVIAQQGSFLSSSSTSFVSSSSSSSSFNQIPFMVMNGLGKRNIIAQGESLQTGKYIVEEVELSTSSSSTSSASIARRLFFLQNEHVIQTQVYMTQFINSSQPPILDVETLAFDYHCSIVMGFVALGLFPTCSITSSSSSTSTLSDTTDSNHCIQFKGIVIGLGGGGLLNFLGLFFPYVAWIVIELDPFIVQLAKEYFGFQEDTNRLKVCIGNGLSITCRNREDQQRQQQEEQEQPVENENVDKKHHQTKSTNENFNPTTDNDGNRLDFDESSITFFVIDVDCKDVTIGMSCPPESFVTIDYLTRIFHMLKDGGILALNVSARDPIMLDQVIDNVRTVFQSTNIFVSTNSSQSQEEKTHDPISEKEDEEQVEKEEEYDELNTVVFCKKCTTITTTQENNTLLTPMALKSQLLNVCKVNKLIHSTHLEEWEESILKIREWDHGRKRIDDIKQGIHSMSVEKVVPKRKKNKKKKR